MSRSAPCYDESGYWRFFDIDYEGLRVLDLGSSSGSYVNRLGFSSLLKSLRSAAFYVPMDIDPSAHPTVCADAHRLPFRKEAFDLVIANNIIEHLAQPEVGVAEMRRVLAAHGQILFTIPFLYPVHEAPNDYTRFTAFGLRMLFRDFEVIEIRARGGWCSTLSQMMFLATRAGDPWMLGGLLRKLLRPLLHVFVQLDRWDKSEAFTRAYYGRLQK